MRARQQGDLWKGWGRGAQLEDWKTDTLFTGITGSTCRVFGFWMNQIHLSDAVTDRSGEERGGSAAIVRFVALGFVIAVCVFQPITLASPKHYVLEICGWCHAVILIAWPVHDYARLAHGKMLVHLSTCLYYLLGCVLCAFEF